ncbi:McrB family protein [Pedobacter psychroterrae]|nr:AAA family ATPase [Pedobacter psychroterrae]
MKIIKVSHGTAFFNRNEYDKLLEESLVCVHEDTNSKGKSNTTQFQLFINSKPGDLVFICHSNSTVDVIGIFIDERPIYRLRPDGKLDKKWIEREYLPLYNALKPKDHKKDNGKWWSPGDNSTCTKVKPSDFERLEDAILNPVFKITIKELMDTQKVVLSESTYSIEKFVNFQKLFEVCFNDESEMLNAVNNLSLTEKRKLLYEYSIRGDVEGQPVVFLRQILVEFLNSEQESPLTKDLIIHQKEKIARQFEKNVFHAWASISRILYPFIYASQKKLVKEFFTNEIKRYQKDLDLESITSINFVDLDGAQNQGRIDVWFAIYNNSHKSQKYAKQLFLKLGSDAEYGLLSHRNPKLNQTQIANDYDYNAILNAFSSFKKQIIDDNADSQQQMMKMMELLEYKKQIILQGPPGTGKTKQAKEIAVELLNLGSVKDLEDNSQFKIIQFHPSYTYEDFVRGIVADSKDDKIEYKNVNKLLGKLAKESFENPTLKYILVIDEINRANLSSVLGELIYALEYRNENVESMYEVDNKSELILPSNLYIIGTMNTADRSVGHIDYAIRRRFAFVDVLPEDLTAQLGDDFQTDLFNKVAELFNEKHLAGEFKAKDVQLGHSYFIQQYEKDEFGNNILDKPYDFKMRLDYEIVPILKEYLHDGLLNNDSETLKKIKEIEDYKFSD